MARYLVVIEKYEDDYVAFAPDLPGCRATGESREQALIRMRGAVQMHLKGLREDKLPIPKPEATTAEIEV